MKVILLTELKGKGGEGDVVEVARGFANNYLLPQKIAVLATKGNLKQLEMRRANIAKREEKRIAEAEALKAQLESTTVKVNAKVGEEGQLFGAVTTANVVDALAAAGIEVDRKRVDLKKPIKVAGEHEVVVSLYREIKGTVTIFVGDASQEIPAEEVAEEAVEAPAEETVEAAEE